MYVLELPYLTVALATTKTTAPYLNILILMHLLMLLCCTFIYTQEELYPTLLFFPAENKSAIAYEGGMSVVHLINFLESHVSNSRHLLEYKGWIASVCT